MHTCLHSKTVFKKKKNYILFCFFKCDYQLLQSVCSLFIGAQLFKASTLKEVFSMHLYSSATNSHKVGVCFKDDE